MEEKHTNNIVIIGDGYVGKTSILNAIKQNKYEEHIPSVYDEFETTHSVHNKEYHFKFIDTAGQEEYGVIRKDSYKDADLFVLCFAVNDQVSFENLETSWMTELEDFKNVPIVLVGTKSDLRNSSPSCVKKDRIVKFQKKIRAVFYAECSAKTHDGIHELHKKILKQIHGKESYHCTMQ